MGLDQATFSHGSWFRAHQPVSRCQPYCGPHMELGVLSVFKSLLIISTLVFPLLLTNTKQKSHTHTDFKCLMYISGNFTCGEVR